MSQTEQSFPLTALRLRFHCAVETHLQLGGLRAGSNLRGALVIVMRRATCVGNPNDPVHVGGCPVCWLVAAKDHPGQERRGYVITPPQDISVSLPPGGEFIFHITLFGDATRYLPYFVLAVPETGRSGVGPGRGRFVLKGIYAENSLSGDWEVLKEGENLVRPPAELVNHTAVTQAADAFASRLELGQIRLQMKFQTPMRLIVDGRLLKSPDFGVFFWHLLKRLDDLAKQQAGGSERPLEERERLWELANRVRLVESQTRWEDVPSGSSRSGQRTWISGLVGSAWYSAPSEVWRELLPWLFWGQIIQVGKDTVKGNGVFRISV